MASLEETEKRISKQRGKKIKVDGKEVTTQKERYLKDGTKVYLNKMFGNPNNPMMNVTMPDGTRKTMNSSFLGKGIKGGSKVSEKDTSKIVKRGESNFMKVFKETADQITKDTKDGKLKTLADLKNHPSYKSTSSGDIKSKLIGAFKKAGGDVSYKPVVKPEVKKKSAGSFAPEKLAKIKSGSFKGAGTSRGPDGVIQIQEPLLLDKKQMDLDRKSGMSQRRFIQKYPGQKFASGGIVNARNGAFIEVQNKFSKRMLPGKKRTTRIY
jgi:hypothetical protein